MRLAVLTPEGTTAWHVIKHGDSRDRVEREAAVLVALKELGLAVPAVLAGPADVSYGQVIRPTLLLSQLPGQPLPWLGTLTLAEANLTCHLLFQGIDRLHQLTDAVSQHVVARHLPRKTLSSELEAIVRRGGAWFEVDLFSTAVDRLEKVVDAIHQPLVFSNGDYNPLNFLCDGADLTGWIDFENACFEDPYAGLASFLTLSFDEEGWGVGVKVGLVERYLYARNVSRGAFAPRLVARCLWRLQREVSVDDEADAIKREHMLRLLADHLGDLGG